jgi:Pup amidohydrolase
VGDANLSEIATFLKVGTTAMVLAMIEDGIAPDDLALAKPVLAIKDVSWDVSLQKLLPLKDGRKLRALDMQWQLFEKAEKWAQERGMASVGEEVGAEVLQRWERVLTALEVDPMSLSKQLDWVAKYRLVLGFQDRHGLTWGDARLRAIDLQYHDMRPERSLFARVGMETLISDVDVESATTEPPTTTRAYFRGRCLAKWPDDIVAANWDSMVFDIGRDPLRRVPMMEPLRGTADLVGSLIDECATAAELLDRLGS